MEREECINRYCNMRDNHHRFVLMDKNHKSLGDKTRTLLKSYRQPKFISSLLFLAGFNVKSNKDCNLLNFELSVHAQMSKLQKNPKSFLRILNRLQDRKNLLTRPDAASFLSPKCSSLFFNTAEGL